MQPMPYHNLSQLYFLLSFSLPAADFSDNTVHSFSTCLSGVTYCDDDTMLCKWLHAPGT